MPARGFAIRSRAASGIMLAGITTGPGGAFPGLGQAGAGNARGTAQGLRPPVGATVPDRAPCHVPGSLAWSCAERARAPTVRAAVERRQASVPPPDPCPRGRGKRDQGARRIQKMRRLGNRSAGVPPPFFAGSEPRNKLVARMSAAKSGVGFEASMLSRIALRLSGLLVCKTRARMRGGKDTALSAPAQ